MLNSSRASRLLPGSSSQQHLWGNSERCSASVEMVLCVILKQPHLATITGETQTPGGKNAAQPNSRL